MEPLFTVSVTPYALGITLSAALCLIFLGWYCHHRKLKQNTASVLAVLVLPLALICARLFYCIVRINFYVYSNIGGAASILWLWEGGFSLWGALGGAVLAGVLAARVTRQKIASVLDALAPSLALFVALERLLEYLDSNLGFSYEVTAEAFQRFPFAVFNENWYAWMFALCAVEALIALAIFVVLLAKKRGRGDTARLFFVLYGASQVLMESLRRDSMPKWLFVRVYQLTSAVVVGLLIIAAVIRWCLKKNQRKIPLNGVIASCVGYVLMVGVVIAMEFALDGKILQTLEPWHIYTIMAIACLGLGISAYWMVCKACPGETEQGYVTVPQNRSGSSKGKNKRKRR